MCFLKTLRPLDEIATQKGNDTPSSPYQEPIAKENQDLSFLNQLLSSKAPVFMTKYDQLLANLTNLVNFNNLQIFRIEKKLSQNLQLITDIDFKLHSPKDQSTSIEIMINENENTHLIQSHVTQEDLQNKVDPLIKKLFGQQTYQYSLQIQEEFPNTIYKERNFNFSFNLIDQNKEKILNSNIVHLCLGICDANGNWLSQNKGGQNFMKGKTEIEMYHGEGSFNKIYPRDVSRHYPEGKVNIIVYAKPSLIKFSNNASSVQKIVKSQQIEPLLIKDVIIKSKKKD